MRSERNAKVQERLVTRHFLNRRSARFTSKWARINHLSPGVFRVSNSPTFWQSLGKAEALTHSFAELRQFLFSRELIWMSCQPSFIRKLRTRYFKKIDWRMFLGEAQHQEIVHLSIMMPIYDEIFHSGRQEKFWASEIIDGFVLQM